MRFLFAYVETCWLAVRGLAVGCALIFFASAAEDRAADLARIHREAMGGQERIEALNALRATGYVHTGGKRVRFTLTAARPDRIRLETESGRRTLVQASDGMEPAWEFDTGTWPPRYRPMNAENAKTFVADAEFDDPLVASAKRDYVFEYAGEKEVNGKKLLRLLVTRKQTESFSVLLDPDTYLIVARVEQRSSPTGRPVQVVTRYDDFRPVAGVLLPHMIVVAADGKIAQQTKIEVIEPNPELSAETFTRPKAPSAEKE